MVDDLTSFGVSAWGRDEAETFTLAAASLVSRMVDEVTLMPTGERRVSLSADSCPALFEVWIRHVVKLALEDGFLVAYSRLAVDGTRVAGRLFGEENASIKLLNRPNVVAVKQIAFAPHDGGFEAQVVLDFS